MSSHENGKCVFENIETYEDEVSDQGGAGRWESSTRTFNASYDRLNSAAYRQNTDTWKATSNTSSYYQTSTGQSNTNIKDTVVNTRSVAETERYLDSNGIVLCKGSDIIRRTAIGKPMDYEQRISLRYLQPPPLPAPGPLTIEEIRRTAVSTSTLTIHEQPTIVEAQPPLILRERPPTPPPIPAPETKTVVVPSQAVHHQSVVIERHPSMAERPRDIIIERWLPYGPLPERQIIRKSVNCYGDAPRPTCTIIDYDYPQPYVNRKFVVVDVQNADPDDYRMRYGSSLLNAQDLVQEARRAGLTEDITSPVSVSINVHAERRTVDYRESRDSDFGGFSVRISDDSGAGSKFSQTASSTIYESRVVDSANTIKRED